MTNLKSHRFYRLRDNLTHYVAANQPDKLDEAVINSMFDEYQKIWDQLGERWLQYRPQKPNPRPARRVPAPSGMTCKDCPIFILNDPGRREIAG
jgi:hypothetical protein